ncbi:MAG: hypothetical protein ACOX9R_07495 [Armatimonadota bacterium]
MKRCIALGVALAMMGVLSVSTQTGAVEEAATVTVTASQWTAAQVAAEIERQTGVQVAVTEWTEGSVTGSLADFAIEDAVSSLGKATRSSWMRFYMLETAPPEVPYTASELLVRLETRRGELVAGLSDEQRRELRGPARADRAGQGDLPEQPRADAGPLPGGAIAQPATPEGAEGAQRGRRAAMNAVDPIRPLLFEGRSDSITWDATDLALDEALAEFSFRSRFTVLADEGLTGTVSLQLEEAPLSEALDAIAEAAGAQWRTVYVVSTPRPLTEEEIAQRGVAREDRMEEIARAQMAEFWRQPPEERARQIDEGVELIERITERMQDATPEQQQRALRFADRALVRMIGYTTELTPEQRQEVKPVLEAMARAMGRE